KFSGNFTLDRKFRDAPFLKNLMIDKMREANDTSERNLK
ncbi:unnamed protein product, partial [Heterotrigona itama]